MKKLSCLLLVFLTLTTGLLQAVDDRFDPFCQQGIKVMKYNMELFKNLLRGFSLNGVEVCNSSFISDCKNVKNVAYLSEMATYKELPENERRALAGGVNAYDDMIDAWAHFYWGVGGKASRKEFYESKKLIFETLDTWQHTPFCGSIYDELLKQRNGTENNMKFLRRDFEEILKKREEYTYELLGSDNIMRKRIATNPKAWPLNTSDLKAWNLPKTYGLPVYADDLKITDSYLSKIRKLDEFCNRAKNLRKAISTVNDAYSSWINLYQEIPKLTKPVKSNSDTRFAQDWLMAEFRELMEDSADLLSLQYNEWVTEVLGENGYKELDHAQDFYESRNGNDVCQKKGPLFVGAEGGTDSIEKTFLSFSREIAACYNKAALPVTRGPMLDFCNLAIKMMKMNEDVLNDAGLHLSFLGQNLTNPAFVKYFDDVDELCYFRDNYAYQHLPPATREAVRPYLEAYDKFMDAFGMQYTAISLDVRDDRFIRGKKLLSENAFHWERDTPRWGEKYRIYLERRQKLDTVYQKYVRDLDEIQRHMNDANPGSLSYDNKLGELLKKEPSHWPLKDSDFNYWNLKNIYGIDWLEQNGEMKSDSKETLLKFNEYAESMKKLPECIPYMRSCYKNWSDYEKKTVNLANDANRMISSSQAAKIFSQEFIKEYIESCKMAQRHLDHLNNQLNGEFGYPNLDMGTKVTDQEAYRNLMNHSGPLFKGPYGTTNSIYDTFEQYRKAIKEYYLKVGK